MSAATADDLAGIPLFDTLEPDQRATIAPWFELEDVSPGVNLTGEGASGYSFFVLRDGAATVTTASPSRVLVLFGTEFRRLQQTYPETAERIESALRAIAQAA